MGRGLERNWLIYGDDRFCFVEVPTPPLPAAATPTATQAVEPEEN